MKIKLVKNIINHVFCWILLLQVINLSIDPHDFKPSKNSAVACREDFSSDETESLCELIAENLFDQEVAPNDEDEIDTSSPLFELYFFAANSIKLPPVEFLLEHVSHRYSNFPSGHEESLFQPPKYV